MSDHHTFAVSEILPDQRVLVTVYVRIGQHIHVTMTLYSDAAMRDGERVMDVHMLNEITRSEEIDDESTLA